MSVITARLQIGAARPLTGELRPAAYDRAWFEAQDSEDHTLWWCIGRKDIIFVNGIDYKRLPDEHYIDHMNRLQVIIENTRNKDAIESLP